MSMIPTQHVFKIQPSIIDPDPLRVIYTFSEDDQNTDRNLYRFPHCPGTFWTHFRFFQEKTDPNPIQIELIVITEENTTHSILTRTISHDWHDMNWAFPSFDSTSCAGLYLKVNGSEALPMISLLGWIGLFPMAQMYLLHGEDHICQFAVVQEGTEPYVKNVRKKGTIHNVLLERTIYHPWERRVPNQPMVSIRPLSHYH